MKPVRLLLVAFCLQLCAALDAQVPQLIHFQGRVAVEGVNFNGTGEFKFALVNGDGSATFWSNDGTSAGGSEPSTGVAVVVAQGLYSVLLGDATLTNMTPILAAIFTNSDVRLRIWFNDRTNGFQQLSPDQRIAAVGYAMMAANVSDGTVTAEKLADGAVTSAKLAANAVTAANLAPGSVGPTQLATNAAADSLHDSGGLVLSDLPKATNLLDAGYVRIGQVTTDVDYWRQVGPVVPAGRSGHSAIWTGSEMIIWGGSAPTSLRGTVVNTGARYNPTTDSWTLISTNGAPSPRGDHAAVWTGTEMIIWGGRGSDSTRLVTGARYDPAKDSWRATSTRGAPSLGAGFSAVWTGNRMIVWGGVTGTGLNRGARYSPASDTWTPTSLNSAPTGRYYHTAVWTGERMIVWGGQDPILGTLNTGGRYDAETDSWTPTSTAGVPSPRSLHLAVWTGSEMIVWGGLVNSGGRYDPATDRWTSMSVRSAPPAGVFSSAAVWSGTEMIVWNGALASGARYLPATNVWKLISTNDAPSPRSAFSAVWTGSDNRLIVWGGIRGEQGPPINTGGRYNPADDTWTPTAANPLGRTNHTAVWTGAEMIVWGGSINARIESTLGFLNGGARFNPVTGRWTPISLLNAPSPRMGHTAVWTGTEMLIWGGYGPQVIQGRLASPLARNDGARYNPASDLWTTIETNSAPVARLGHTAVWTGEEMIVWGGTTNAFANQGRYLLNSGGRYDPDLNAWASISSSAAPASRVQHSAVWTGKEMIIWGGLGSSTTNVFTELRYLNTGARYLPNLNAWLPTSTNGAPQPTTEHTVVWSGTQMIIWGAKLVGGRYSPTSDSWLPISATNAPNGGAGHSAVWTGYGMIVWGGIPQSSGQAVGGRYDPSTDAWVRISTDGMPATRARHTAVWTGNSLLVFGGTDSQGTFPDATYSFSLTKPMYLYKKP